MRNYLQIFFLALLLLSGSNISAGVPQFHFENITSTNGLSSNEITCLYQDHDGFLWIGTHFGLNRYDGNEVQTFYHESGNPNSISGNDIVQIIQDKQNIFWIATKDGGLTRYDPSQLRSKQFIQFQNNPSDKHSIATNRLTCVYDYSDEYLLIGAEVCTGFFINKKSFEIRYVDLQFVSNSFLDPSKGLSSPSSYNNWIHHIEGNDSTIYISLLIGGFVFKLDRKNGLFNIGLLNSGESPAFSIPSFMVDGNKVWLASWRAGLMTQEGFLSDTIRQPIQKKILACNDQITCLAAWDENFILAGTKATGIYVVNKNDYSAFNLRHDRGELHSLAANKINCIFKDHEGILWIGTSNGLSKYNPEQWQFHEELLSPDANFELTHFSVDEDASGTLRVCTSEGIYKKLIAEKSFHLVQFHYHDVSLSPTFIFKINDGSYYLCTEKNFYSYDPSSERITQTRVDSFGGSVGHFLYDLTFQVRSAVNDTIEGRPFLIFGALGDGLIYLDLSNHQVSGMVNQPDRSASLNNNLIHVVTKDRTGNIWVGTANGLCKWEKSYPLQNDFVSYLNIPGNDSTISGNNITGIYADEENHLWITTNSNGLNEFDGKIFHHYLTSSSSGNNMLGIYADDKNRFWIPTSHGFEVFDRSERTFDEIEMPNPEWILRYPARIFRKTDGTFCYGAGNYLITFNPDSFSFKKIHPKIYLTDFKVMDQSIFKTKSFDNLNFPHNRNFFTVQFSSLQLSQPSTVQYQYKLEGLNKDWVSVGREGKASFTSLPPGHYEFKVRGAGTNADWGDEASLLSFTVMKPFWLTWWFFVTSAALIVLAGYVIFQIRLRQLMRLQEIRHRIATDLHDDIGSALSSISISSQLAKKFSGQDADKFDRTLNSINVTSREMLESMSDIVWAINPKNDSGKNMIMKMQRVTVDLLESKGIKVQFDYDDDFEKMKLGMEGRKNLFLIFKEAVNNVSKHSGCNEANIKLKFENHHLTMQIEDDGKGFIITKSSLGNGIDSIKHRTDQLNGKLKIESEEGRGTKLIVDVDLTKIRD